MKNSAAVIFCFLSAVILSSCGNGKMFSDYRSIDSEKGWSLTDTIVFEPEVMDTIGRYNVFVNVRHGDTYPYRNLYINLTTVYPDGRRVQDTLECILADEQHHWRGDGSGDVWDNAILLQRNVRFPRAGKYKFVYEHGMRVDPVPMIMDLGLTIEKAD